MNNISRMFHFNQIVLIILCSLYCQTNASAFSLIKPFQKATNWIAVKSGLKPTGDNINAASRQANAAAAQATITGKEAETAIQELKPKAGEALESVTRTSDAAGAILTWIKWPVVVSIYSLALWLVSLALRGWHTLVAESHHFLWLDRLSGVPMPKTARILLVATGSIGFFTAFYMLFLDNSDSFREPGSIPSYGILSLAVSLAIGTVLFWLPMKRIWSCLAIGFLVPVVALAFLIQIVP